MLESAFGCAGCAEKVTALQIILTDSEWKSDLFSLIVS